MLRGERGGMGARTPDHRRDVPEDCARLASIPAPLLNVHQLESARHAAFTSS